MSWDPSSQERGSPETGTWLDSTRSPKRLGGGTFLHPSTSGPDAGLALGCTVDLFSLESEQRAKTMALGSTLGCLCGNTETSGLGLSERAIYFCPILSWLSPVTELWMGGGGRWGQDRSPELCRNEVGCWPPMGA